MERLKRIWRPVQSFFVFIWHLIPCYATSYKDFVSFVKKTAHDQYPVQVFMQIKESLDYHHRTSSVRDILGRRVCSGEFVCHLDFFAKTPHRVIFSQEVQRKFGDSLERDEKEFFSQAIVEARRFKERLKKDLPEAEIMVSDTVYQKGNGEKKLIKDIFN